MFRRSGRTTVHFIRLPYRTVYTVVAQRRSFACLVLLQPIDYSLQFHRKLSEPNPEARKYVILKIVPAPVASPARSCVSGKRTLSPFSTSSIEYYIDIALNVTFQVNVFPNNRKASCCKYGSHQMDDAVQPAHRRLSSSPVIDGRQW